MDNQCISFLGKHQYKADYDQDTLVTIKCEGSSHISSSRLKFYLYHFLDVWFLSFHVLLRLRPKILNMRELFVN